MPPVFPSKRSSLGASESFDLVEAWKFRARSRLERAAELAGPKPRLIVRVDPRVIVFAGALGVAAGPIGVVRSVLLLLSVLLVHELSRAVLARALGRSSRVSISLTGGHTEISGAALKGRAAFGFALLGSLANVLLALALLRISRSGHDGAWRMAVHDFGLGHLIWGVAQALPLIPFRAGTELSRRLSPPLRSGHAIASGGLAIGAAFAIFTVPKSPLLLFALLFVVVSSARAAFEGFREEFDRQNDVPSNLVDARAALDAGTPLRAVATARAALGLARSKEQRNRLWSTIAWGGIGARDPFAAHAALQQLPADSIDVPLLAAYLLCCNRNPEGQQLLQEARALGQRSRETSKLLIEVLFAQGDREGALRVATDDAAWLTEQDRRAASFALAARDEPRP